VLRESNLAYPDDPVCKKILHASSWWLARAIANCHLRVATGSFQLSPSFRPQPRVRSTTPATQLVVISRVVIANMWGSSPNLEWIRRVNYETNSHTVVEEPGAQAPYCCCREDSTYYVAGGVRRETLVHSES
jgi:hypothetical protein